MGSRTGQKLNMDEEVLRWCRQLIACPSVTNQGTREIAQLCASELLAPSGLAARLIPSPAEGANQVNLLCTRSGREHDRAPIVLNTHLDTVPPGEAASWTECPNGPFTATIKADRIYGLGAADTKLDFVAKALALAEESRPRRDIYLVATFGEEHGLVGAKEIAGSGLLPKGALAFVGEPSRLEVITAHKGLMVFQLRLSFQQHPVPAAASCYCTIFEGRSAHSSTPLLGVNAIRLAIDALAGLRQVSVVSINGGDAVNKVPARCEVTIMGDPAELHLRPAHIVSAPPGPMYPLPGEAFSLLRDFIRDLTDFAERAGPPEPDYAPPTLTCNPGVISSSDNSLVLEFELRPPPALPLDEVRRGVTKIANRLVAHKIEVSVTEQRANPGFRTASESETVELAMTALAAARLPLKTGVKAGCTEAGIYAAAGLQPVVFGPGPSTGVIHAPNEYNLLTEVESAVRFYRELMRL
jgi:acetylornithine deacetylase/succinyl-diaminopimelate desuccinylase-like protein